MASNVVCPICRRYDDDCRCDRHAARDLQAQLQTTQQREVAQVERVRAVAEELRRLAMADPMKGFFDDIRTVRQEQLLRWAATLLGEPVPVDPELRAAEESLAKLLEQLRVLEQLRQMKARPLLFQREQKAQQQGGASGNAGHGHVYPRPDGVKARCGGPGFCYVCSAEYARKAVQQQQGEDEAR